jgi:hypothetical protein
MPNDIIAIVRDPLTIRPGGEYSFLAKKTIPSLDEAGNQTELTEFQTSSQSRDALRSAECLFVVGVMLSTIKKLAFYVQTMFGSTYTCESSFSSMNAI